jgi:two-component system, NtrC family, sensor kinase
MNALLSPQAEALGAANLIDAIAVPAALHAGGQIIAANEALCRLCSRSLQELQALAFEDLVGAADRESVSRASATCLEGEGLPPVVSSALLTPDGGERPVEIHARPVRLGSGTAVVMTCIDQSDILHVQTSLIGLSEMLRQIVDGAPVASLVIDQNHRVTHWNTACERMTGLKRQKVLGSKEGWRAFYDDERPLLADLIVDGASDAAIQAFYGGQAQPSKAIPGGFDVEAFFPQFGSSGAWIFFTAAPLRDASGKVIGAIETLQDVSVRRAAEQELRRHRNELERLVKQRSAELASTARELELFITTAPIGVSYTENDQTMRVNASQAKMFGYTEEEMIGLPLRKFHLSEANYQSLGKLASKRVEAGRALHHEMWMRHADGHPIWVQIDSPLTDGVLPGLNTWWMMQDRTEIRAAQEQLQARFEEVRAINTQLEAAQNQLLQQDKMASIGQLAAGVAHEINNPVGFVSSNLNTMRQYVDGLLSLSSAYEVALASPGDPAATKALNEQRETVEIDYLREDLPILLDECADGLGRVKKIVQDLKDFSRVDQANWQEADLNVGLESTLNVVRHEVKYKAEVEKNLAPLPPVVCLAAQLNQVFMNLIVNATHAIPEHGTITLSSGTQDNWAWVQVEDTGCGMPEDVKRRIFEPFYTTKDVGKGTGLGLSLSFSIVQKHGGVIRVKSVPGQGSAFRVWLPIGGPESLAAGAVAPVWEEEGETS